MSRRLGVEAVRCSSVAMMPSEQSTIAVLLRSALAAGALLGAAGGLTGCGAKENPSTQTAARVNKEEITVHQIGAQLSQQAIKGDQGTDAERQILERLINRELAVQKAMDLKLDREPKVVQAIDSARQDIIARAYADKLGEGAAKPNAAEIKKYYDDHPALFSERKIFQLQEVAVEADAKQIESLKAALPPIKTADELVAYLKANNLKFASSASVRAAEQLPLPVLPVLARMSEGQSLLSATPKGAQIIILRGVRAQPVDGERASRAIEQFLHNEQKRKLIADDMKALRAAARIDYRGRFAASAPPAAEVAASAALQLETKPVNEAAGANAAMNITADAAVQAASGIDSTTVNKGLGLK
jgi:EpsD family peptidyl-prolyl cis-trans isomerase